MVPGKKSGKVAVTALPSTVKAESEPFYSYLIISFIILVIKYFLLLLRDIIKMEQCRSFHPEAKTEKAT